MRLSRGRRGEIGVGFGGGEFRDASGDAHLAVDVAPIKHQGGVRIRRQLAGLAAFVVGEEEEAALVDSF